MLEHLERHGPHCVRVESEMGQVDPGEPVLFGERAAANPGEAISLG
jgi:hypothetical protein